MSKGSKLAEWQQLIAQKLVKDPETFKKALLPLSRGQLKKMAQNELAERITLTELIKEKRNV